MSRANAVKSLSATFEQGAVITHRVFQRFSLGQRWEHGILILSFTVLLFTGLPQKYFASWGHFILTTPQSLLLVRQIHRIAAVVLILEALYHVGHGIYLMARRRLSAAIFPSWQDVSDAWMMVKYLLFISRKKPESGKYNFEQKITYWFLFVGIGIMIISGLILWFPLVLTRFLPGDIIPAAQLAHSNEAIAAGIFVLIWHFFHVHLQRLNLSIFTGRLDEEDMREYHAREFERLTGEPASTEEKIGPSKSVGEDQ
jgi:formate dehydrogenase subunit gamma